MKNPFKYGGVVTGPYFVDRAQEINELAREMENNNRVFLVSPRRFGKTCLLHNLRVTLTKNKIPCAYIDLNAYPDLRGFAEALTGATTRALETNTDRLLKIFSGFKKLRPKVSVDADGNFHAGLELAVSEKNALAALVEGMAYTEALAKKKRKNLVVIIDEFSDIEKYNGGTVEKALRSQIQDHRHIGYIFSGSEQSVMLAMIQDSARAFYKQGRIMKLGPIHRDTYRRFIQKWLKKGDYTANAEELQRIFHIGEDVPYNIQRLCYTMWEAALETKVIDAALMDRLPSIIAKQDSAHYEMLWQTATKTQKVLLFALADDPEELPFSKDFQMKYGIGPASTINAAFVSLIKKGIVYKTLDGRYRFVDRFMPYWIAAIRR